MLYCHRHLIVVNTVKRRRLLVVDIDLVWLYSTSHAHHAQIVLELEPAFSAPDEVNIRRYKVRHQYFTGRQVETTTVTFL